MSGAPAAAPTRLGPEFAKLFTANLTSSLGDGIAKIAAPLLAVQLTTDPVLISGVAALSMLPWLLFAIPAGILIDRVDRRVALAAANSVRAILALGLLVLVATSSLTIVWLCVLIFLYGVGETIYDGSVRAVVPSIVAKPLLPRANSRIEAGELIVQNFLSGPFTSLLFAVSVLIPLGTNVAAFAVAAGLALALPRAASGRQYAASGSSTQPWYRQFADGYRFIWGNRMLVTLWFLSSFVGLCFTAATATWVLFVVDHLGLDEALFGVFMLTGAAGGLLGSALAQPLKERLGAGRAMGLATIVASLSLVLPGLVPQLWAAAVSGFVSAMALLVWNILVMSLRQSIIPGRLLGRVHGSWRTLLWGIMPLGAVLGGLLARIDITLPLVAGGAAATVAGLVFFRFLSRLPNPEDVDNGDEAGPTDPLVQS